MCEVERRCKPRRVHLALPPRDRRVDHEAAAVAVVERKLGGNRRRVAAPERVDKRRRAEQRLRPVPRRREHGVRVAPVLRRRNVGHCARRDVGHARLHLAAHDAALHVARRLQRAQREQGVRRQDAHARVRRGVDLLAKRQPGRHQRLDLRADARVEKVHRHKVLELEPILLGIRLGKHGVVALEQHGEHVAREAARRALEVPRPGRRARHVETLHERVLHLRLVGREPEQQVNRQDLRERAVEALLVAHGRHILRRNLRARLHARHDALPAAVARREHKVEVERRLEKGRAVHRRGVPRVVAQRKDKVHLAARRYRRRPERVAERVPERAPPLLVQHRRRCRARHVEARVVHVRRARKGRFLGEAHRRARRGKRQNPVHVVGRRAHRHAHADARKLAVRRRRVRRRLVAHLQQIHDNVLHKRKLRRRARRKHKALGDFRHDLLVRKDAVHVRVGQPLQVRHAHEEAQPVPTHDARLHARKRAHVLLREEEQHVLVPARRHGVERRVRARHARKGARHKVQRAVEQRRRRLGRPRAVARARRQPGPERARRVVDVRLKRRRRRVVAVQRRQAAHGVFAALLELAGAQRQARKLVVPKRRQLLIVHRRRNVREVQHVDRVGHRVVVAHAHAPRRLRNVVLDAHHLHARGLDLDWRERAPRRQHLDLNVGHPGQARRAVEAVVRARARALAVVFAHVARVHPVQVGIGRRRVVENVANLRVRVQHVALRQHRQVDPRRRQPHVQLPQRARRILALGAHAVKHGGVVDAAFLHDRRRQRRVPGAHQQRNKLLAQRIQHRHVGERRLGLVKGLFARHRQHNVHAIRRAAHAIRGGDKVVRVAAARVPLALGARVHLHRQVFAVRVKVAHRLPARALVHVHVLAVARRQHLPPARVLKRVAEARAVKARGRLRRPRRKHRRPQRRLERHGRARANVEHRAPLARRRVLGKGAVRRAVHRVSERVGRRGVAHKAPAHEPGLELARRRAPVPAPGVAVVALLPGLQKTVPALVGPRLHHAHPLRRHGVHRHGAVDRRHCRAQHAGRDARRQLHRVRILRGGDAQPRHIVHPVVRRVGRRRPRQRFQRHVARHHRAPVAQARRRRRRRQWPRQRRPRHARNPAPGHVKFGIVPPRCLRGRWAEECQCARDNQERLCQASQLSAAHAMPRHVAVCAWCFIYRSG